MQPAAPSSAPVVQNLSDIISQIGAAYAPEKAQIDQNIADNTAAGAAQQAGLASQQSDAFAKIGQQASDKGMAFSGFTPDAQAKYTGSTYLPALARLQQTIAATRDSLLGKKASLDTQANTQGYNVWNNQKSQLSAYNNAVTAAQAKAQQDELNRQTTLQAAQIRASSVKQPNPAAGYGVQHTATGGYNFHGANGAPITLAQYASATGASIPSLLASSTDPTDAKILQEWNATNGDPQKLNQLASKYSYVFGG